MESSSEQSQPLLLPKDEGRVRNVLPRPTVTRRITVEPALFMYIFYYGTTLLATQQYIYIRVAQQLNYTGPSTPVSQNDCSIVNTSDPVYIEAQHVQSVASNWNLLFSLCSLLPGIFSTLFLGAYSDVVGRKPPLLSTVLGAILSTIVLLFVNVFDLPIWVILVGIFLSAVIGQVHTFMMACFSYVTDITSEQNRSFRIVVIEVALGLSVVLCTLCSGFIIKGLGFTWTYAIILFVSLTALLYILFLLPESHLPQSRQRSFAFRSKMLSYFSKSFTVYTKQDEAYPWRRFHLLLSLFVIFVYGMSALGQSNARTLFLLNFPFCLGSVMLGLVLALQYLLGSVASILATKCLQRHLGDLPLVQMGLLSWFVSFLCFAVARSITLIYIGKSFNT